MLDSAAALHDSDSESVRSTHSSKSSSSKGNTHHQVPTDGQNEYVVEPNDVGSESADINTVDQSGAVIKKSCAVTLKKLDFGGAKSSESPNAGIPATSPERDPVSTSDHGSQQFISPVAPRIQTKVIDTNQDIVDLVNNSSLEQAAVSDDVGEVCISSADEGSAMPHAAASLVFASNVSSYNPAISEDRDDVITLSSTSDDSADESDIPPIKECVVRLEKLNVNFIPDGVILDVDTALSLTCSDDRQENNEPIGDELSSDLGNVLSTVEHFDPAQISAAKEANLYTASVLSPVEIDQPSGYNSFVEFDSSSGMTPYIQDPAPGSPDEIPFNIENKDIYLSPVRRDSVKQAISLSPEDTVIDQVLNDPPEEALNLPNESLVSVITPPPLAEDRAQDKKDNLIDTNDSIADFLDNIVDNIVDKSCQPPKQAEPSNSNADSHTTSQNSNAYSDPASKDSSADCNPTSKQLSPDQSRVRMKLKRYSSAMRSKLKLAIENVRDKEQSQLSSQDNVKVPAAVVTERHNSTSSTKAEHSSCGESDSLSVSETSNDVLKELKVVLHLLNADEVAKLQAEVEEQEEEQACTEPESSVHTLTNLSSTNDEKTMDVTFPQNESDSDYVPSLDEPDSDDVKDEDYYPTKRSKPKPACAKARDARRDKERMLKNKMDKVSLSSSAIEKSKSSISEPQIPEESMLSDKESMLSDDEGLWKKKNLMDQVSLPSPAIEKTISGVSEPQVPEESMPDNLWTYDNSPPLGKTDGQRNAETEESKLSTHPTSHRYKPKVKDGRLIELLLSTVDDREGTVDAVTKIADKTKSASSLPSKTNYPSTESPKPQKLDISLHFSSTNDSTDTNIPTATASDDNQQTSTPAECPPKQSASTAEKTSQPAVPSKSSRELHIEKTIKHDTASKKIRKRNNEKPAEAKSSNTPKTALVPILPKGAIPFPGLESPAATGPPFIAVKCGVMNSHGTLLTSSCIETLPVPAGKEKVQAYQEVIEDIQRRLDQLNSEIKPGSISNTDTERKTQKKKIPKEKKVGKSKPKTDTKEEAKKTVKKSNPVKDTPVSQALTGTGQTPTATKASKVKLQVAQPHKHLTGTPTELSPDSAKVNNLVSSILSKHPDEPKPNTTSFETKAAAGPDENKTEAVSHTPLTSVAKSTVQNSILFNLLDKTPKNSDSNDIAQQPSSNIYPSTLPSIEKVVTTIADSRAGIASLLVEDCSPLPTINMLTDCPPSGKDTQPSAQREGDVLMSLEAVLEVINEDIGDLRASSPADYDEYNGEQTEPLDLSLGSGRGITPNKLTKFTKSQPICIQLDGSPESSSTENEKSVERPTKSCILSKIHPNKSSLELNYPGGIPAQGFVASVYPITNSAGGAGENDPNKNDKDKRRKDPKGKERAKEPKKAKEPKPLKGSKPQKQPKLPKEPKPPKATKSSKEQYSRLGRPRKVKLTPAHISQVTSLCCLPGSTLHTTRPSEDRTIHYPGLGSTQVDQIRHADRWNIIRNLVVDVKDKLVCEAQHNPHRCTPFCKDRGRVYKAPPHSHSLGFPTDNMRDDVSQVVYDLLQDMKDRVQCDLNHSQQICNKGYTCKYSPRVHPYDTGYKIRVSPVKSSQSVKIPTAIYMTGSKIRVYSSELASMSAGKTTPDMDEKTEKEKPSPKKITLKANTKKKISSVMARVSKRKAAQAAAITNGDRQQVVTTLVDDVVSRVVCDTDHWSCRFRIGCRPGQIVYLSPNEIESMNQDFMAADDTDLLKPGQGAETDREEVVSDLMHCMLNTIVCDVDHLKKITSSGQCQPGIFCLEYRKHWQISGTNTKSARKNQKVKKVRPPKTPTEKKEKKPAGVVVVKPKLVNTKPVKTTSRSVPSSKAKSDVRGKQLRKMEGRRDDEGWSDLDSDQYGSGAEDADMSQGTHATDSQDSTALQTGSKGVKKGTIVKWGTSVKRESQSEVIVTSKHNQRRAIKEDKPVTDSKGMVELPDLGIDVVLAATSSDEDDASTEPDSAGETTNRRKTSRRNKKLMPREQREKQRQQMIAARRATLKYMGTPRSIVLAQLIQEEATKQCAQILLPKNLPEYQPEEPVIRDFLFPADLTLTPDDITEIITSIFPDGSGRQLISDMCDLQASKIIPDDKLLYQLCLFISTSTVDPSAIHSLIQVISKYSCTGEKRCPLPACNSAGFDNWLQVGTHVLNHLPKVYHDLMSEAFRCTACWRGFPTPHHHRHHYTTSHEGVSWSPPVLVGFPSMELLNVWTSPNFMAMSMSNWAAERKRVAVDDYSFLMHGDPVSAVPPAQEFYCCDGSETWCQYSSAAGTSSQESDGPTLDAPQPGSPLTAETEHDDKDHTVTDHGASEDVMRTEHGVTTGNSDTEHSADSGHLSDHLAPVSFGEGMEVTADTSESMAELLREADKLDQQAKSILSPETSSNGDIKIPTGDSDIYHTEGADKETNLTSPSDTSQATNTDNQYLKPNEIKLEAESTEADSSVRSLPLTLGETALYERVDIECVHRDHAVQQTVIIRDETQEGEYVVTEGAGHYTDSSDTEDGETELEYAADMYTDQLLGEMNPDPLPMPDLPAFICWFCARPFIGRGAFYIHLLQEAMALPAGGVLSGLEFSDISQPVDCQTCNEKIQLIDLQKHLTDHHAYVDNETGHSDCTYTKPKKQCPCDSCTEVFDDWNDLGNHIAHEHTPASQGPYLRHTCTACGKAFKTYYHAKAHWEDKYQTCAPESQCTVVETFEGHNLPYKYWTDDLICNHDVTFTKHKKFTFCSQYKTSSHVMCFVCQSVFNEDAEDLDADSLQGLVGRLQTRLSHHMIESHGVEMSTGVKIREVHLSEEEGSTSNADADTDVESVDLSDSFNAKETAASSKLSVRVEQLNLSQRAQSGEITAGKCRRRRSALQSEAMMHGDAADTEKKQKFKTQTSFEEPGKKNRIKEKKKLHIDSPDMDDDLICGFHKTAYTKTARTGAKYCAQCKDTEKWETGEYDHILNGPLTFQPNKYCRVHDFAVLRMNVSNRNYSYCVSCADTHDSVFKQSMEACSKHGPHKGSQCPKCIGLVGAKSATKPPKNRTLLLLHERTPTKTDRRCNIHTNGDIFRCFTPNNKEVLVCRSCRKAGMISGELDKKKTDLKCAIHPQAVVNQTSKPSLYCGECAMITLQNDIICRFHPTKSIRLNEFGDRHKKYLLGCMQCLYLSTVDSSSQKVLMPSQLKYCMIHPKSQISEIDNGRDTFCHHCAADCSLPHIAVGENLPDLKVLLDDEMEQSSQPSQKSIGFDNDIKPKIDQRKACIEGHTLVRHVGDGSPVMVESIPGLAPLPQSCPASSTGSQSSHEGEKRPDDHDESDMSGAETSSTMSMNVNPAKKTRYEECRGDWTESHAWRCNTCDVIITTLELYRSHYKHAHAKSKFRTPYPCPKCSFVSNDIRNAQRHYLMHSHPEAKCCDYCSYLHIINPTLHMRNSHGITLAAKGKEYKIEKDQYGWTKQHVYGCPYCPALVSSYEGFRKHMILDHNSVRVRPLYACPHCNYVTDSQTTLNSHVKVHAALNKHQCPSKYCYFIAEDPQAMIHHLLHDCKTNTKTAVQMTMCSECYFVSWDLQTSNEHAKLHVKTEKKASPVNKGKSKLYHKWTEGHLFHCTATKNCRQACKSQAAYKSHMKLKHKGFAQRSLIPCEKCNYVTDLIALATKHAALHLRRDALRCQGCHNLSDSEKAHSDHLKRCKATHRMKKPSPRRPVAAAVAEGQPCEVLPPHSRYFCRLCPAYITDKATGEKHILEKHDMNKTLNLFPCNICPYVTITAKRQAYHRELHTKGYNFKCEFCGFLCLKNNPHTCGGQTRLLVKQDKPGGGQTRLLVKQDKPEDQQLDYLDNFPKGYKYYCKHCPESFTSDSTYRQHMKERHKPKAYSCKLLCCKLCPAVIVQSHTFINHIALHSSPSVYKCNRCHFLSETKKYISRHVNQKNFCSEQDIVLLGKQDNPASDDEESTSGAQASHTEATRHADVSHPVGNVADDELSSSIDEYDADDEDKSERESVDWEPKFSIIKTETGAKRQAKHNQGAPDILPKGYIGRCRHCPAMFTSRKAYRDHAIGKHNEKHTALHLCDQCPHVTNKMCDIVAHNELHQAEYVVRCGTCFSMYKHVKSFERHVNLCKHRRCTVDNFIEIGVRPDSTDTASADDSRAQSVLSQDTITTNTEESVDQEFDSESEPDSEIILNTSKSQSMQGGGERKTERPVTSEEISQPTEFPEGYTYYCRKCPKSFTDMQNTISHLKEIHDMEIRPGHFKICKICKYIVVTTDSRNFIKHEGYHGQANLFRCKRCYHLSPYMKGMKQHIYRSLPCTMKHIVTINADNVEMPIELEQNIEANIEVKSIVKFERQHDGDRRRSLRRATVESQQSPSPAYVTQDADVSEQSPETDWDEKEEGNKKSQSQVDEGQSIQSAEGHGLRNRADNEENSILHPGVEGKVKLEFGESQAATGKTNQDRIVIRSAEGQAYQSLNQIQSANETFDRSRGRLGSSIDSFRGDEFPEGYKAFCSYCPQVFNRKTDLVSHLRSKHGYIIKDYTIFLCDKCHHVTKKSVVTHNRHKLCHEMPNAWRCNRCLFLAPLFGNVKRHVAMGNGCTLDDMTQINQTEEFSDPADDGASGTQPAGENSHSRRRSSRTTSDKSRHHAADEEIVKQESYSDSYVAELDIPYSDVSEAEDKTVSEISAEHKVTENKPASGGIRLVDYSDSESSEDKFSPHKPSPSSSLRGALRKSVDNSGQVLDSPAESVTDSTKTETDLDRAGPSTQTNEEKDRSDMPVTRTRSAASSTLDHRFFCAHCNYSDLYSQQGYTQHMSCCHPGEKRNTLHPCKECTYVADSISDILQHNILHKAKNTVQCEDCMFLCVNSSLLELHHAECRAVKTPDNSETQVAVSAHNATLSVHQTTPTPTDAQLEKLPMVSDNQDRSLAEFNASERSPDAKLKGRGRVSRAVKERSEADGGAEDATSTNRRRSTRHKDVEVKTEVEDTIESEKQVEPILSGDQDNSAAGNKSTGNEEKSAQSQQSEPQSTGDMMPTSNFLNIEDCLSSSNNSLLGEVAGESQTDTRLRRASGRFRAKENVTVKDKRSAVESDSVSVKSESSSVSMMPPSDVSSRRSSPERSRRASGRVRRKHSYVESISDPENIVDVSATVNDEDDTCSIKSSGSLSRKKTGKKRTKPDSETKRAQDKRVKTASNQPVLAPAVSYEERAAEVKLEESSPHQKNQAIEQKMREFFSDSDEGAGASNLTDEEQERRDYIDCSELMIQRLSERNTGLYTAMPKIKPIVPKVCPGQGVGYLDHDGNMSTVGGRHLLDYVGSLTPARTASAVQSSIRDTVRENKTTLVSDSTPSKTTYEIVSTKRIKLKQDEPQRNKLSDASGVIKMKNQSSNADLSPSIKDLSNEANSSSHPVTPPKRELERISSSLRAPQSDYAKQPMKAEGDSDSGRRVSSRIRELADRGAAEREAAEIEAAVRESAEIEAAEKELLKLKAKEEANYQSDGEKEGKPVKRSQTPTLITSPKTKDSVSKKGTPQCGSDPVPSHAPKGKTILKKTESKRKSKINLSEYRQRTKEAGIKSPPHDTTSEKSNLSTSLPAGVSQSSVSAKNMNTWESYGIMKVTAKFSPSKLIPALSIKKQHACEKSLVTQKLSLPDPPKYTDYYLPLTLPTATNDDSDAELDAHVVYCKYCDQTIHGIMTIMSHIRSHDLRRCFRCNRFFPDENHLRSHIACVHLNMQYAEFEEWSKANSSEQKSPTTVGVSAISKSQRHSEIKSKSSYDYKLVGEPQFSSDRNTKSPRLTSPPSQPSPEDTECKQTSPVKGKSKRLKQHQDTPANIPDIKTGTRSRHGSISSDTSKSQPENPDSRYSVSPKLSIARSLRNLHYAVQKVSEVESLNYGQEGVHGKTRDLRPVDHRSASSKLSEEEVKASVGQETQSAVEDKTASRGEEAVSETDGASSHIDYSDSPRVKPNNRHSDKKGSLKKDDLTRKKRTRQPIEYHPTPVSQTKTTRRSQLYEPKPFKADKPEPYIPEPYVPERFTRKANTNREYIPQPISMEYQEETQVTESTTDSDKVVPENVKALSPEKPKRDTKSKSARSPTKAPADIPLEDMSSSSRNSGRKTRTTEENEQLREKLLAATRLDKDRPATKSRKQSTSPKRLEVSPRPSSSSSSVPEWVVVDDCGDEDYRQKPDSLRSSSRTSGIKSPEAESSRRQSPGHKTDSRHTESQYKESPERCRQSSRDSREDSRRDRSRSDYRPRSSGAGNERHQSRCAEIGCYSPRERSSGEERRSDRYSSSRSPEKFGQRSKHPESDQVRSRSSRSGQRSPVDESRDRHRQYPNDKTSRTPSHSRNRNERYSNRDSRSERDDKSSGNSKERLSLSNDRSDRRKRRRSGCHDDHVPEKVCVLSTHDGHIVRVRPKEDGKFELA